MLGSTAPVSFVASSELDRSRDFYEQTLGPGFVERTDFACVLRCGGGTVRVALVAAGFQAAAHALGWVVEDVKAAARELAVRGVSFTRYEPLEQDDAGIWRSPNGADVACFRDPDGNVLSITEV